MNGSSRERGLPSDSTHRVARWAIRSWRAVLALMLGLLCAAALAWEKLPRLEDPRIEPPAAAVSMVYPGASPEDVESQVLEVVEPHLNEIDRLVSIESTARPSLATLVLKFQDGTNMDTTVERIRGKISALRSDLPQDLREPSVSKFTTAFTAQMLVGVTGFRSDRTLRDVAEKLRQRVRVVPGVSTTTTRGAGSKAIQIRLDAVRLAHHGFTPSSVAMALQSANVRIPAGNLDVGDTSALLKVESELHDAALIAKVPLGARPDVQGNSRTIVVEDVASVEDTEMEPTERFMHEGIPGIVMEVRFRSDVDAMAASSRVRDVVSQFQAIAPSGVRAVVAYDQSEWVSKSLHAFTQSLLEGVILVLLVVTLGLGWRYASAVAIALPLSIGGALVGLYAGGLALEQVSVAGLIVALGLLVDDAVVVTESIQLTHEREADRVRAAILGTARVFHANNFTTMVACAAFVPFFFMGGDVGMFIRGLPTTVILALLVSLVVAQTATPWLASLLAKPRSERPAPTSEDAVQEDWSLTGEAEAHWAFRPIKRAYGLVVPSIVHRPWSIVAGCVTVLIGSLMLLPKIGLQFFPKAEKPFLFVSIEMTPGTELSASALKLKHALEKVENVAGVEGTTAMFGAGLPPVFIGRESPPGGSNLLDVLVRLKSDVATAAVATSIRQELADIPAVRVRVEELFTGPPIAHPIVVRVIGDDHGALRQIGDRLKSMLRDIPGTENVQNNLSETVPTMRVELDTERAIRHGVTSAQVASTLRWLYGRDEMWKYQDGRRDTRVLLEDSGEGNWGPDDVEQVRVRANGGQLVPIYAFGSVEVGREYAALHRRNLRRVAEVTSDLSGGVLASAVVARLKKELSGLKVPDDTTIEFAGEAAETEASFGQLALAAVGSIVLIAVLLLKLFDSFRLVGVVIVAIPFVLIGVLPGLAVTHNPFGFMAFLGTVALIGVYVNHKIYFIERALGLMRRGMSLPRAIAQAGYDRVRPVVLTALTAILGLLPLTLGGGAMWAPFGWVNIFGLVVSVVLSLTLVPALMMIVYRSGTTYSREVSGEERHIAFSHMRAICAEPQARSLTQ